MFLWTISQVLAILFICPDTCICISYCISYDNDPNDDTLTLRLKQGLRPEKLDRETRKLGRGLVKTGDEDDEDDDEDDDDYDISDMESANIIFTPLLSLFRSFSQVNVNVLEAQKLVGVNINPAVYIRVGEVKKKTATQKSTNCPFYNEVGYLTLSLRGVEYTLNTIFSLSVATEHRFYQKWAPLTDPSDTRTGIKGFVKCTLSVVMKGDTMGMPSLPPLGSQNNDIETNLLLPKRMPMERPWAKFLVKIYKAEGLPSMSAGFLGSFSKMMGDKKVFIDPYVQVTFAGQQGETSVESNTNTPEWNEQISFIEQFPPLARRIKVQILDDANIGDVAVGTHFLDMQQISNPNRNGFNPTFGPSWINLYGSPQNSALGDIHQVLNEGLSEGIFYRGRMLLSLSVEVYSSPNNAAVENSKATAGARSALGKLSLKKKSRKSKEKKQEGTPGPSGPTEESEEAGTEVPGAVTVEVEEIHPLPENFLGEKDEFLLFASLFEVTMIDPIIGSKPVTFELSIGNTVTFCPLFQDKKLDIAGISAKLIRNHLTITYIPGQCKSFIFIFYIYRSFSCVPMTYEKPCMFLWTHFEDHCFRYHNVNWLHKMADRLVSMLTISMWDFFFTLFLFLSFCLSASLSLTLYLQPQSTLPDVFVWMMSVGKRVAFARIPSHSILFSLVEEERGKDCGKLTTMYLKAPGCPVGEIFAKLEVYLWLGITKYSKNCVTSLPAEFKPVFSGFPVFPDSRYFQLRAHIYQARGIVAADDNGLSDPFTKVVFSTQCQVSRVMEETLSPTWCELLLFDQILMEGSKDQLRDDPPIIIINVYDYDTMPLGRAFAEPELKFVEEPYKKPMLKFFDISRGKASAGELLAAFELIELDYSSFGEPSLPADVYPREPEYLKEEKYYIIPDGVRPVLKKFRIEVLYWGVRDLKRVNLFEVERPQVRMECAGQRIESEEIEGYKVLPNFKEVVKHFDVDLPELTYLHPPLTIFVMEQRAFGRLVLVGTHVVQSLMQFAPKNLEEWGDDEEEPESWGTKHIVTLDLREMCHKCLRESHYCVKPLFSTDTVWLVETVLVKKCFLLPQGSFLIYPISPEDEHAERQITKGIPQNTPIKVLVRVYVVKATNLAPTDPNGKADPYVVVKVGGQSMDNKDSYIPKQLNPVFGEVFELTVSFPLETEITLMVFDHNLVGSDDLIGETRIDLENRFYSHHHAGCGIALYYDKDGYNKWRDAKKPSAILAELCRNNAIPSPEYRELEIKVLNKIFKVPDEAFPEEDLHELDEHKALSVLHRWGEMREFCEGACPLVPEHVEVRSLLNPEKPGLPQGYAHMWIDMFPMDVPAPPPIDIKPRLPVSYELRVIIWNTDDVVLDDVNPFTGNKSSDIYMKGWIKGLDGNKQETDVHFNSLTGEGNFNWRFVFRFDYLPTEKEITYTKKESIFSLEESEFRQPAVLVLQVWDYDLIAANDFLGSIELRLNDMVRAAKTSGQCSIKMAEDKASPRFSIFLNKRMKGWWPLIKLKSQEDIEREEKEAEEAKKNKKKKKNSKHRNMKPEDLQFVDSSGSTYLLMGKVEAEFQLVTLEEAELTPVGKARKEPEPLDKPDRPKTTFNWFINPMKTFIFFIWKKYKKYIIALLILAILLVFLILILYTLPGQISTLIVNG
uniref:Fer-1-like protein 4 n=1 Tax=Oncorhynchus kisutch TaxID=8019 RepID=A0A8C7I1A3_ONCKI